MATANLALRFLLELAGIATAAYSGYAAAGAAIPRWVAAVGAAAALIAVWALIVAPKADNGLSQPMKDAIGTVVLLAAAASLALTGQVPMAVAFAVLVVGNAALLFLFGQEARNALAGAAR